MGMIRFFGYGALKKRDVVKAIIGHDPGEGKSAVVDGYQLAYQVLDEIPAVVRSVLERSWGSNFRAYTLRRGKGVVVGVVWELTDEDIGKIQAWEFVGSWREMGSATARTRDGEAIPVTMAKVPDNQPVKEIVDGINYEENLNTQINAELKEASREHDEELLRQVRKQLEELRAQGAYGKQTFA